MLQLFIHRSKHIVIYFLKMPAFGERPAFLCGCVSLQLDPRLLLIGGIATLQPVHSANTILNAGIVSSAVSFNIINERTIDIGEAIIQAFMVTSRQPSRRSIYCLVRRISAIPELSMNVTRSMSSTSFFGMFPLRKITREETPAAPDTSGIRCQKRERTCVLSRVNRF